MDFSSEICLQTSLIKVWPALLSNPLKSTMLCANRLKFFLTVSSTSQTPGSPLISTTLPCSPLKSTSLLASPVKSKQFLLAFKRLPASGFALRDCSKTVSVKLRGSLPPFLLL